MALCITMCSLSVYADVDSNPEYNEDDSNNSKNDIEEDILTAPEGYASIVEHEVVSGSTTENNLNSLLGEKTVTETIETPSADGTELTKVEKIEKTVPETISNFHFCCQLQRAEML